MIKGSKVFQRRTYWIALPMLVVVALVGFSFVGTDKVSANHPVLVEGNCDSPVPGTTLVAPGTCGDFDGDGRIGTAEDTDGADRIFGTINAAMGPGTGAAAGTGANHNGKIVIVASGRFAEAIYIGQNLGGPAAPGVASPGNVVLEAAPGVEANIDAVLQGDPAGGNATRQGGTGIQIVYVGADRFVVLRNLQIRNFTTGISVDRDTRVHIDNCRLDSNLNYGIRSVDSAQVILTNSQITGSGFRIGGPSAIANPGHGMSVENGAQVKIAFSVISYSAGAAVFNTTGNPANVLVFKLATWFNAAGGLAANGGTIAPNPNFSF